MKLKSSTQSNHLAKFEYLFILLDPDGVFSSIGCFMETLGTSILVGTSLSNRDVSSPSVSFNISVDKESAGVSSVTSLVSTSLGAS